MRCLIVISLFFLGIKTGISQGIYKWKCADEKLLKLQRNEDAEFDAKELSVNLRLKNYIQTILESRSKPVFNARPIGDSIYTIPVVVHVIYPFGEAYGTGSNISYAQIRSQLEALNAAFSKSYPSYNGQSHPGYAQDTRIRFCLARNAMPDTAAWANGPSGIEYGVRRYADKSGAYNHLITSESANQLKKITHPSFQFFPFDKYLNIWVVKKIDAGDVMGYAPKPLMGNYPLDGIVMRSDIFGDNTTGGNYPLGFGLVQGKVLAHEAGHYFNLYHTFQGGCSGKNAKGAAVDACDLNGDFICDIEPSTTQNVYCTNDVYNSCTANYNTGTVSDDMINDYMSYADDDCMNTFTLNQAQRIWATLNIFRFNLWQDQNLSETGVLGINGCIPPFLNATIKTDKSANCKGTPVKFFNFPNGNTATQFHWEFPGGTPSSSNASSSSVVYNNPGTYKVSLTVSDGTNTISDFIFINVSECRIDSSLLTMSHWYFGNFGAVDFSTGYPIQSKIALDKNTMKGESSYPEQLSYVGATVSPSDSAGNLLFYCNGVSVWNKNHEKISTAPIFGKSDINASTGLCYIPYPGQSGKYFIAGASANLFTEGESIRFVLVDVNSNTVSAYQEMKHPSIPNKFSEFLTVVPHCNGTDFWIITKGYGSVTTNFYSFLVTGSGIDPMQAPVISTGFAHPAYQGSGNQLKANRRGDKLFLSSPHGYIDIECGALYDFDSRTGQVKNEKKIPNVKGYNNIQGGAAFSPNGEFLYLMRSSDLLYNVPPYWLFQYRVSDFEYRVKDAPGFYYAASFQQGPDNQIYISTQDNYLARITNPDIWDGAIVEGSFMHMSELDNRIATQTSLPAFIDARLPQPDHPEFVVESIACDTYKFTSLCFDSFLAIWNFGDGSAEESGNGVEHFFRRPGEYIVELKLSKGNVVYGSVSKKITVLPLSIEINGPDSICDDEKYPSQFFAPVFKDVKYKWSIVNGLISGPSDLSYAGVSWSNVIADSGIVKLEISRDNCSLSTSKIVRIIKRQKIQWEIKKTICLQDSVILLSAGPPGGIYFGKGVSGNEFFPAIAGKGEHEISYKFSGGFSSCPAQETQILKVQDCSKPLLGDCFEIFDDFKVYLNSSGNELVVNSPYSFRKIQLYSFAGQKIKTGVPVNNKLKLPFIPAGIYVAVIFCEEQGYSRSFKVVKLN